MDVFFNPINYTAKNIGLAFNHILSDLSLIVNQFESLSAFSAGVERLEKFYKAIGEMCRWEALNWEG